VSRRPKALPRRHREGFILVTVLWMLGALAALVSVYTAYISDTAMAAAVRDDGLAADGLFTAGIEMAALQLVSVPKDRRPLQGSVSFSLGEARITADFRNEAARIDLNTAEPGLLAALFTALGAEADASKAYAARIAAWRSPQQGTGSEAEAAVYRAAGLGYGPRGGPFVHPDELWLVAGLPAARVEAALPHLTVYSGGAEPSASVTDPLVLAALDLSKPPTSRTPPGTGAQASAPPEGSASDAVRISISVDLRDGGPRRAEAVILVRDFGDDPYRVLSWRDDMNHQPALRAEPSR
jgi:general secretion pathway protein K